MGGVDRFDQLITYYQMQHSYQNKWYMWISNYLMEMAMVNSFLLYRKAMKIQNLKRLQHYEYRLCVIKNLVKPFHLENNKNDNLWIFDELKNDFSIIKKQKHMPDQCQLQRMSQKQLCVECFIKGKTPMKHYTKYWCKPCLVPLCPDICYDEHRRMKFLDDQDSN